MITSISLSLLNWPAFLRKTAAAALSLGLAAALIGLAACASVLVEGPTDEVIRQHAGSSFKSMGDASQQKVDFQVTKILRGNSHQSEGERGIAKGTWIFPIRCMATMKEGTETSAPIPLVLNFYKDQNGAWQTFTTE